MERPDLSHELRLSLPAEQAYVMAACMTVCGLGMTAGLDVDTLGDLRTVTRECLDCLTHQPRVAERILLTACVSEGRLRVGYHAQERGGMQPEAPLDMEITRGVLETLMPEVRLTADDGGVYGIDCSMPV